MENNINTQFNKQLSFCYGDRKRLREQLEGSLEKYQSVKERTPKIEARIKNIESLINLC